MTRAGLAAAVLLLAGPAAAQPAVPSPPAFIEIATAPGAPPVLLRVGQVIRVGQLAGNTVIDTTGWVTQRTPEPVDSVARRIAAAGRPMLPLTDAAGGHTWVAAAAVVQLREAQSVHAPGARALVALSGPTQRAEFAVRETVPDVVAALARLDARPEPAAPR